MYIYVKGLITCIFIRLGNFLSLEIWLIQALSLKLNRYLIAAYTNNENISKKSQNLFVVFCCRWGVTYSKIDDLYIWIILDVFHLLVIPYTWLNGQNLMLGDYSFLVWKILEILLTKKKNCLWIWKLIHDINSWFKTI